MNENHPTVRCPALHDRLGLVARRLSQELVDPRAERPFDRREAVHIGHSTGGGEVARYVACHGGDGRVAKAVLIGAVPPLMLKTDANPGGLPIEVFDGSRAALVANRAQFYRDVPAGPFYGFNRPGATAQEGFIANWWRQGMQGGAKAHYDCIKAFSETDFTEDLKAIAVPTLVMHGTDDQIVPIGASAHLSPALLCNAQTKAMTVLGMVCAPSILTW